MRLCEYKGNPMALYKCKNYRFERDIGYNFVWGECWRICPSGYEVSLQFTPRKYPTRSFRILFEILKILDSIREKMVYCCVPVSVFTLDMVFCSFLYSVWLNCRWNCIIGCINLRKTQFIQCIFPKVGWCRYVCWCYQCEMGAIKWCSFRNLIN